MKRRYEKKKRYLNHIWKKLLSYVLIMILGISGVNPGMLTSAYAAETGQDELTGM